IDHLCLNKACCNPEHLEVVTTQENTRRRDLAHEYDKYCRNGHARTSENTYIAKTGMRSCRICRTLATRAYRERKKLLAGVKPRVKRQVISGGKTHSKSRAIFEGKNSGEKQTRGKGGVGQLTSQKIETIGSKRGRESSRGNEEDRREGV